MAGCGLKDSIAFVIEISSKHLLWVKQTEQKRKSYKLLRYYPIKISLVNKELTVAVNKEHLRLPTQ